MVIYTIGDCTALSASGRMALVSCYSQVVPTTITVFGVVHLRVDSRGLMMMTLSLSISVSYQLGVADVEWTNGCDHFICLIVCRLICLIVVWPICLIN